jgi:drug/metabolite transporter (DMT)-like permease
VLLFYIVTNFCLAYLLQQAGFRLLKAWEVAALTQSAPIFSTLFAVLLLRDTLMPLQGLGGLLALLGGLVVALSQQSAAPVAPTGERAAQPASQRPGASHDA